MHALLLGLALTGAQPVHLADFLREARENNPELREARAQSKSAQAMVSPAGAFDDPMLMLQLWNAPVNFSTVPIMIQLSQNLPLGGKRGYRRDTASAEADGAVASGRIKVLDVEQEVTRTYFDLFMADRVLEIDARIENTLHSLVEASSTRVASGRGELVEQLKAESEVLKTQSDLEAARAVRTSASSRLAVLVGRDPGESLGETASPKMLASLPTEAELRKRALESRPELALARANISAAEAQVQLAEAGRVPDLGLSLAGMHAFGGAAPHDFLFFGVQGNLPIFSGEKNGPQIDGASAKLEAMKEAERAAQNQILAQLAEAYAHVVSEEKQVDLHHRLVPLSQQVLESALAGYGSGRTSFLMVLDSERELQMHELELATHLGAYEQDVAALERAVGSDLGLAASAEAGPREGH
jgi:outer membrane protein TolC